MTTLLLLLYAPILALIVLFSPAILLALIERAMGLRDA